MLLKEIYESAESTYDLLAHLKTLNITDKNTIREIADMLSPNGNQHGVVISITTIDKIKLLAPSIKTAQAVIQYGTVKGKAAVKVKIKSKTVVLVKSNDVKAPVVKSSLDVAFKNVKLKYILTGGGIILVPNGTPIIELKDVSFDIADDDTLNHAIQNNPKLSAFWKTHKQITVFAPYDGGGDSNPLLIACAPNKIKTIVDGLQGGIYAAEDSEFSERNSAINDLAPEIVKKTGIDLVLAKSFLRKCKYSCMPFTSKIPGGVLIGSAEND